VGATRANDVLKQKAIDMSFERERFGFTAAAEDAFRFLVEDFGFQLVCRETTFVRYESRATFVNIYHGRSSYEIGIEVGPRAEVPGQEEEKFMLGDILETCGEPGGAAFRQAGTREEVSRYLYELAALAKKYAVAAFRGEKEFFLHLRETQTRLSHEFLLAHTLRRARSVASEAFGRGDYRRVVAELRPFSRYLDEEDGRRLAEAERRIG
jgi:hypothetical protein